MTIKIWYQSMGRQDLWSAYGEELRRLIDQVRDPDTEVQVYGTTKRGGAAEQFRYLEFMTSIEVVDNLHKAIEQGFDAFVIGNIVDAALFECRELSEIPVIGLCENACLLACMMGSTFSFVTINDKFVPRVIENVARYGLRERLAAVNRMDIERILGMDEAFHNDRVAEQLIEQFQIAADANTDARAEVVIPAGGVVMALLAKHGVHRTRNGAPILNGITAAVKMAETTVRLRRLMGGNFTSKTVRYAPPSAGQLVELRKYYGDHIYPGRASS